MLLYFVANLQEPRESLMRWNQRRPTQEARELSTGSGRKIAVQGLKAAGLKQQGYCDKRDVGSAHGV